MSKNINLNGKEYWRSLDQLADTPQFREFLQREFPQGASEFDNGMKRRDFIALLSASMALASLAGCRRPVEKIIPYVIAPEEIVPGVSLHYATTMPLGNSAYGLIVESHEGRPTKIEGNPAHPSTKGRSNAHIQASVLGLYDPGRSGDVLFKREKSDWSRFLSSWEADYGDYITSKGEGLAVLSESFSSPSLARLAELFRKKFPRAKWVTYEPVSDENIYEGTRIASGKGCQHIYNLDKCRVILSLESDFLQNESENIANSAGFADGRRVESEKDEMNRLYIVESGYSLTGGMADHRLRTQSGQIGGFAAALMLELESQGLRIDIADSPDRFKSLDFNAIPGYDKEWVAALARDLMANKGRSLVLAGRSQSPAVHAIVYAINHALGNIGRTAVYRPIKDSAISSRDNLIDLVGLMNMGRLSTLFILGGNPVYDAPADLGFETAIKKVEHTIHLSGFADETSKRVEWHIPRSHYLESWGDAVSVDGVRSVIQPMIQPLYGGRGSLDLLHLIVNGNEVSAHDIVRETWQGILKGDFEKSWERVLHDGIYDQKSSSVSDPGLDRRGLASYINRHLVIPESSVDNLEIIFRPSPNLFDGRFANNGWLQELPDSMTKLSWDNAALISMKMARKFDLANGDMVELDYDGRKLELPIWIMPGQADNSITLTLGYGRIAAGQVGDNVGFNAYKLRTSKAPYFGSGLLIRKTGAVYKLATTQDHSSMEGRPLVREASLEHYREEPNFAPEMVESPPLKSLWAEHKYDEGNQWGMTIDLNVCTGCNACTIACQSENNIPIVGKEQVSHGREMHWIRLDRYFEGDIDDPSVVHQPVGCQHCEMAPCEQVCPVAATVHDKEGLNTMVYNRCVGTRYCSNNCPYKVRRFNFFNFTKDTPEVTKMAQNPDVTVRSRGVMEKCTYCVQRISEARIKSKAENREIADGDIVTACQQSCPTGAIVFGNVNDSGSTVSKMKNQNRNYGLLAEFNTRPRTSFLAKIRNPNPELISSDEGNKIENLEREKKQS